jgi:hypoxanthine phosphoribosyltransferase
MSGTIVLFRKGNLPMTQERLQLLFSREQIEQRTRELAEQISADYHGRPVALVGILKGCFVFLADLIRNLDLDVTIDFVQIESYGSRRESTGVCTLVKDLGIDITGREVLIIEDIVDTGATLAQLLADLRMRSPLSICVCALLNKQSRRRVAVAVDYVGFEVEDVFVVGCGLDFSERYRALPGIYALLPDEPA